MGEACLDEVKTRFNGNGENIFVSVRVRPLNANEIARRDVSDWECINDDTIFFRNNLSLPERSVYPSAYTFDRVFGCDCSTRQVYEEGAKEVAFSVVNGINSSIFAYGQTSSGKTYTMGGITEYAMADIYEYIEANKEREYFLKFSAMEIYNESVRDLLSYDCTPLRLLDDPERGTIVEKLTEETLMDWNHLRELLSLCEAQRQVGETSLNETSSRSHQILRLTVDSSSNDFLGNDHPNTLTATVNFIDLAGSERASQSLSAGSRLKEGCHINRSLLTLGTVIRKLSKGRNGHVPFRDSKLTRILQSSLDGNARTAIICTMSPARTHVEQSRNTLLFASCAKEVTTNAQVNVVVSDKALVKHLQRELSRLEVELRSSRTNSVTSEAMALLMEKDIQIVELKKEIAKLIAERDHAQSHAEDFPRRLEDEESSFSLEGSHSNYPKLRVCKSWAEEIPTFDISSISDSHPTDTGSFQAHANCDRHSKSKLEDDYLQIPDCEGLFMNKYTSSRMSNISGETNPCKGWDEIDESIDEIVEDLCKEVRCIEMEESSTKRHIESKTYFHQENPKLSTLKSVENVENEDKELASCLSKEEIELSPTDNDRLLDFSSPEKVSLWIPQRVTSTSRLLSLYKSRSCKSTLMSSSSSLPFESVGINGNTLPIMPERGFNGISMGLKIKVPVPTSNHDHENETLPRKDYNNLLSSVAIKGLKENTMPSMPERDFNGRPAGLKIKVPVTTLNYDHENEAIPRKDYNNLVSSVAKEGLKEQNGTASCDEDSTSIDTIKEMVKLQNEKLQNEKLPNTPAQVTEPETKAFVTITKDVCSDPFQDDSQSPQNWPLKFKSLQADIIELWDACNTSLLHRTYFYLLFEGDLADAIYMEVELRRLSFLKDTFSQGKETVEDGHILTLASSMKALRQEREMLSKQMLKKLSEQERENLYLKWGVDSKTKNRRLQLADRLWTDTNDMSHITESANVVANLVSFIKPVHANKEMFGLNFTPRHTTRRKSFSWKRSLLSLL